MPDEAYWESLFDLPLVMTRMGIGADVSDVAELGCGYGTFSIPVAQSISGTLYTFDIEPTMVERTRARAAAIGVRNISCQYRDVMQQGFGLPDKVDAALLFNILHCDDPLRLIRHAADVLNPGGRLLIIHWRHDPATPRGPALEIRPKPEQIVRWTTSGGDFALSGDTLDLPPWHYGLVFNRLGVTPRS